MKTLSTIQLNLPKLMDAALKLPSSGHLTISNKELIYLDVSNKYIHTLFPLLEDKHAEKPDYFGDDFSGGAHISVIYPEENKFVSEEDLGKVHHFKVIGVFKAQLNMKQYYVLHVESPSLLTLRKKYDLSDMLSLKSYGVTLHITIGIRPFYAAPKFMQKLL